MLSNAKQSMLCNAEQAEQCYIKLIYDLLRIWSYISMNGGQQQHNNTTQKRYAKKAAR